MAGFTRFCPQRIVSLLLGLWLISLNANAQDWLNFDDVTATNMVADNALGAGDTVEKDLAVADLDNDGDDDLVVVRKVRFSTPGGLANVLFMNENGVLTDRTASLAPAFLDDTDDRDVVIIDLNGDNWLDLVTATTFSDPPRVYMNQGEIGGIWQGLVFSAAENRIPAFPVGPKFCAVAAGDVTGNNRPDLYFVDYDNTLEDRLLINDGNGFFSDETTTRMTAAMAESVFGTGAVIADINGDGFRDIVKNSASGSGPPPGSTPPEVRVLYNNGSGNFTTVDVVYSAAPYMIQQADFNLDNRVDLFVVDDGQDSILLNTGNTNNMANFERRILTDSPNTSNFGGNVTVADLDNDGFQDVLVSDVDTDIPGCNRTLTALQHNSNQADPRLRDPLAGQNREWLTNGTFDTAVADFNNDGAMDIWSGNCDGNRLFFGRLNETLFSDSFESMPTTVARARGQR